MWNFSEYVAGALFTVTPAPPFCHWWKILRRMQRRWKYIHMYDQKVFDFYFSVEQFKHKSKQIELRKSEWKLKFDWNEKRKLWNEMRTKTFPPENSTAICIESVCSISLHRIARERCQLCVHRKLRKERKDKTIKIRTNYKARIESNETKRNERK